MSMVEMRMIIVKIVMIDGDKIGVEINSKSCLNKLTLSKRVRPTGNQVTPIGPLEHRVGKCFVEIFSRE